MKFFINWSQRVPIQTQLKDTDNEKARYMKNQSLTKSMNIDIWLACTLNQLLIRGSYTQIKSKKKKVVKGKLRPLWGIYFLYFVIPVLFFSALAFDRQFLFASVAFSS